MNRNSVLSLLFFLIQFTWITNISANTAHQESVQQIGIAVNNIHKSIAQYKKLMDVSHWAFQDLYTADENSKYPSVRMATAQFGDKHIALVQPLAGPSLVKSHLEKYGPSIFHLGIQGIPQGLASYPSHIVTDANAMTKATWINSYDDLGINILSYDPNGVFSAWGVTSDDEAPTATYNHHIFQLGIVSDDLTKTAMNYFEILGAGPWVVIDFKDPHLSNAQYLGAKGNVQPHIKVAYAIWGNLQLELLMPVSGPSPHRDHLMTKGFGAHHLSYGPISDHDQAVQQLKDQGIAIKMQSDNGGEGRTATYMDTLDELGFVLELTRPFKGSGTLPFAGTIPSNEP